MYEVVTKVNPSPKEQGLYGVRGVLKLPFPKNTNGARVCRWCHGDLPQGRTSWCSSECYDEYSVSGGDWRVTKRAAFRRDGGACRHCGASSHDRVLEVDHIKPVIEGGDDRPSNLRLLCQPCHQKETAALRDRMRAGS